MHDDRDSAGGLLIKARHVGRRTARQRTENAEGAGAWRGLARGRGGGKYGIDKAHAEYEEDRVIRVGWVGWMVVLLRVSWK